MSAASRLRRREERARAAGAGVTVEELRLADEAVEMLRTPPLMVLVFGGQMDPAEAKRIRDYVEAGMRNKDNFHLIRLTVGP